MDEIFRFLFLRPPDVGAAVPVNPSPGFAADLEEANSAEDRRAALKRAAAALIATERGIAAIEELTLGAGLLALASAIEELDEPDPCNVGDAIQEIFERPASELVAADEFQTDRERLADNLIAAKLLSADGAVEARTIEALIRLMELIERIAAGDPELDEERAVHLALERPTIIADVVRAPIRETPSEAPPAPPEPGGGLDELRGRIAQIERLAHQLRRVPPGALARPADVEEPVAGEGGADPAELLRGRLVENVRAGELDREGPSVRGVVEELATVEASVGEVAQVRQAVPRLLLHEGAAAEIAERHPEAVEELGLELARTPLPAALDVAAEQLTALHAELAEAETESTKYTQLGSHVYDIDQVIGGPALAGLGVPAVPESHGTIKPVGVGDLLVVRQHLKRYEGGELGHIENILKGEFKKREHKRSRTTEETTTTEEETQRDEERDSQTTERFELQREASSVVKDDMSFKAGLSVSGSYGPTVEFKASTDFAMNHAKEEAAKTATSFSKEVVERASSKVSERHREERILRTLEVFEEVNAHGVDNTGGGDDVIGVYQWVDKVYEAQVFNYGKRMMFDVMAPEPAAFWIYANANKPKAGASLTKPDKFTLKPTDLSPYNYAYYVQKYEVSGVKPPPQAYTTVAKTFEGTASHDDHGGTKVTELPIPDGYEAISAHATANSNFWTDWKTNWSIQVAVGKDNWYRQPGSFVDHYFTLDNEAGSVSVAILVFGIHFWMVGLEVDCQLTPRAYAAWQLETHAAIQQAYLKLQRDYEDQLAALEVQAANEIQGRNPLENRMLERAELKKQAISMFTAQHYDLFGAIETSSQGYPQPWLSEADAEGRYIRFFEQAFEWEQMMYLFYPYFWGRKDNWRARALLQDTDQQFAEFLKAGAARVVVPVRPGFEAAIAHFLDTGEIWDGADPPTLTSPLYVSIIDEIKECTQAPGSEIEQGEPWDVRLPTTLVKLRDDGSLPSWTKQDDGSWLSDD
jgi:hypothetical protein